MKKNHGSEWSLLQEIYHRSTTEGEAFLQCVYRWSKVSSAHIFMELHHSEGDFDNDYDRNNQHVLSLVVGGT